MAIEDINGNYHNEKDGRYQAKNASEAAKTEVDREPTRREDVEWMYNSDSAPKTRLPVRIPLNFFSEGGIKSESEVQLRKGIRSLEKRIAEHEEKIEKQPNSYNAGHWKQEIKTFKENIKNRLLELEKRKDKKQK